jgi:CRISPR/Cas system CMR subunit Cmr4 (Cas7 group RAMP superfamily)
MNENNANVDNANVDNTSVDNANWDIASEDDTLKENVDENDFMRKIIDDDSRWTEICQSATCRVRRIRFSESFAIRE